MKGYFVWKTSIKQVTHAITTTKLYNISSDGTTDNPSSTAPPSSLNLKNHLKEWKFLRNNVIVYNIPETEMVKHENIETYYLNLKSLQQKAVT